MQHVLIAGGTGLIGTRLSEMLVAAGHRVSHLSRRAQPNGTYPTYQWDVERGTIDDAALEDADVVINLAGAGIADKPWTPARKQLIIDSRVNSTRLLREAIQRATHKPKLYLSGSAVGFYGSRGDELLKEDSPAGEGFLSQSCAAWELAAREVAATGIRTVALRIGIVLSTRGGALEKMLLPLRFFLGVYFGNGRQWYSWIHIEDLCRMFIHAIENEHLQGTYNAVAPHPASNKSLVQALAAAFGRPALILPAPAFAMRLAMGEMAAVVLDSTKVSSQKITSTGFRCEYPTLLHAVNDLLTRHA